MAQSLKHPKVQGTPGWWGGALKSPSLPGLASTGLSSCKCLQSTPGGHHREGKRAGTGAGGEPEGPLQGQQRWPGGDDLDPSPRVGCRAQRRSSRPSQEAGDGRPGGRPCPKSLVTPKRSGPAGDGGALGCQPTTHLSRRLPPGLTFRPPRPPHPEL